MAFSLTACEDFFDSRIDYFVESPDPKLVVNATLTPGPRAIVEVSHSVPVFGSTDYPKILGDAVVLMYEDGVFWDSLSFNLAPPYFYDSAFVSSKQVQAEANYSISVKHNGFSEAHAVTTIPKPTTPTNFTWQDYHGRKAKFTLPALRNNEYYYIWFGSQNYSGIYFKSNSPILEFDNDAFFDLEGGDYGYGWAYVRPELMNGKNQEVVVELLDDGYAQNDVFINLFVLNVDLFKQHRDLLNFDPDNPFSEPTQIHVNVENGYGVFSAYSTTVTPIQ